MSKNNGEVITKDSEMYTWKPVQKKIFPQVCTAISNKKWCRRMERSRRL